ncbi:phytase [Glycomyces buryatensis]|uniref:phytase n=1 Tax=Glycomyces buryatensis TaxID=2570927 RepID=UPI001B3C154E|nr:phytase [Glycomyces buryatensis]
MRPRHIALTALGGVAVIAGISAVPALADHAAPAQDDGEAVTATLETPPLFDADDADADDPAIWIHPEDDDESLVITTAKEAGMNVYDLDGELVQHIEPRPAPSDEDNPGRYNNVDIVTGFELGGEAIDLAVASDRGMDTLGLWTIDPDSGELTDVSDPASVPIFSESQEDINEAHTAYGLTTWADDSGAYALVSRNAETQVALLKLVAGEDGIVGYETVRVLELPGEFTLPDGSSWAPCADPGEYAQFEGMVVDDETGIAYLGQEDVGIWRVGADLTGEAELVDTAVEFGLPGEFDPEEDDCVYGENPGVGGDVLHTDVEGLTIYEGKSESFLLASSQGDDTFAVYSTDEGNEYLGSFAVGDGDATDSTQQSDGADVVSTGLGDFEDGLLVVQDGDNTPEGSDESSTNFKFVDWEDVVNGSGIGELAAGGRHSNHHR